MGDPAKPGPRFTAREWALLIFLSAVQFTHVVDFMIVMPLGPQYIEALGLTPAQFGRVVASYAYAAGVAGLLAALVIDRFDRRQTFLVLYTGFALATLACGFAPDYPALVIARAAAGAFGGVLSAVVMAIVADRFADERRGSAMGVVMTAFSVATVAGIPAGLWVAQWLQNWRSPFWVLGGLSFAVLAGAWAVLPAMTGHMAAGRGGGNGLGRVAGLFARPAYLSGFGLMAVLLLSGFMVVPYISQHLVGNVHITQADLVYVFLFGGAATFFSLPWVGRMADRYGKRFVFRLTALASVAPILVMTHLPDRLPLPLVVATGVLFMVCVSARGVPATALVAGVADPADRGAFLSVMQSVQQLAIGLASEVAGLLLTRTPDGGLAHYDLVGWIGAGLAVASAGLAGLVGPPGRLQSST